MTKVLVAVDGSDLARRAAEQAVRLLAPACEITVLSVVSPMVLPSTDVSGLAAVGAGVSPVVFADVTKEARAAAGDEVQHLVATLGATARARIEEGEPGPTICRIAAQEGSELVVIGSHGSGVVKRAFLGSVSHHVLHHAPCPVLVVREQRR